jgi:hypothetical protein
LEPLNAPRPLLATDDRTPFDSGRASMNAWFKDRAWDNQVNNLSRTTVVTDAKTGRIVAYLTLAAGQIERAHLPKKLQRNKPLNIPILLLGQLAVDVSMQRRGAGPADARFASGARDR